MIAVLQTYYAGTMQRRRIVCCTDDIAKHGFSGSVISLTQQTLTFGDTLLFPVCRRAKGVERATATDLRLTVEITLHPRNNARLLPQVVEWRSCEIGVAVQRCVVRGAARGQRPV